MALQENVPETEKEWKTFLISKLKFSAEVAKNYAELLFNEGYCGETMKHLFAHATPGQAPQSLLTLGVKVGHCLKLEMLLRPTTNTNTSGIATTSVKVKIPRPVITLDVNHIDYEQFCYEWKTYRLHYQIHDNDIASQFIHH